MCREKSLLNPVKYLMSKFQIANFKTVASRSKRTISKPNLLYSIELWFELQFWVLVGYAGATPRLRYVARQPRKLAAVCSRPEVATRMRI